MGNNMSLTSPKWTPSEKSTRPENLLSILYVDDDPTLLNISKIFLERRSDICVTTVSCVDAALSLLKNFKFDVILSDYQMPDIDGIGFLKILQKHQCPIPFILFTGKKREEVVIEAINNGATYYIQKGGDPRALFAELEHMIREASRRRHAETALQRIELQYQTLFEYSGTSIVTLDEDMIISRSNAGFLQLTGYSHEEVVGRVALADFIVPEDIETFLEQYHNLRAGLIPAIAGFEVRIRVKDQQHQKISINAAMIPTTSKSIVSLTGPNQPALKN
jgi:PAS domain S-box-containing protein